jgi:hypothetical protein
MKSSLFSVIFIFSLNAFAVEDLASVKAAMLQHLDQRISNLQEARACVAGAAKTEDIHNCRKQMSEKMDAMRKKSMEERKQRKNSSKS